VQIRGMHTIIRDESTKANDFVFYADRINRLVVEAGLGLLPFNEKTVTTPTGHAYVGVDFARKLCGVSIIRSGEHMAQLKSFQYSSNVLVACVCGIVLKE
jgi:uridine kinase